MTGRKRFSCDDHKKFGTWPPDIGQHRLHFIHLKPLLVVHAAVCAGMYPIITADKQPQPSEKVESSQRTARWQGQKDALGLDLPATGDSERRCEFEMGPDAASDSPTQPSYEEAHSGPGGEKVTHLSEVRGDAARYSFDKIIGKGSSAKVWRAFDVKERRRESRSKVLSSFEPPRERELRERELQAFNAV